MIDHVSRLTESLSQREIPALNGLRAIAVSSVMIYHAGYTWFPGGQGVTLFFVLSGFLITRLLLIEAAKVGTISLRRFYLRRSLRIFPAFYLYWLLVVVLLAVTGRTIHWGHVWSSFFYVGNYWIAASLPENSSLSHAWSLAIEEQFYLLLPGLFLLLRCNSRKLVIALSSLVLIVWVNRIVRVEMGGGETYLYHATDTRMDHLLIGCLLAILVAHGVPSWTRRLLTRFAYSLTIGALLISMAASYQSPLDYRMTIGFAIEPVLLGLIILQSVCLRPWILDARPVAYLGKISYGVYLFQQIAVPAGQRIVPGGIGVLDLAGGVALTIALAALSYRLWERPFIDLKNRLGSVR